MSVLPPGNDVPRPEIRPDGADKGQRIDARMVKKAFVFVGGQAGGETGGYAVRFREAPLAVGGDARAQEFARSGIQRVELGWEKSGRGTVRNRTIHPARAMEAGTAHHRCFRRKRRENDDPEKRMVYMAENPLF